MAQVWMKRRSNTTTMYCYYFLCRHFLANVLQKSAEPRLSPSINQAQPSCVYSEPCGGGMVSALQLSPTTTTTTIIISTTVSSAAGVTWICPHSIWTNRLKRYLYVSGYYDHKRNGTSLRITMATAPCKAVVLEVDTLMKYSDD